MTQVFMTQARRGTVSKTHLLRSRLIGMLWRLCRYRTRGVLKAGHGAHHRRPEGNPQKYRHDHLSSAGQSLL